MPLRARFLGCWQTPWWEDDVDKGPKTRAGFTAIATIDRHDYGVSWNAPLDKGDVVVGNLVEITRDAEAIQEPAGVRARTPTAIAEPMKRNPMSCDT